MDISLTLYLSLCVCRSVRGLEGSREKCVGEMCGCEKNFAFYGPRGPCRIRRMIRFQKYREFNIQE